MKWKFRWPLKNFFGMIKKACEKGDEVSSTRLTSFIISAMIVLFSCYFLFVGTYIVVVPETTCAIPNEMIIVFGALLAHQLTLLGINKHNETKQKIANAVSKKPQE